MPVLAGPPPAAEAEFPHDLPTRAYLGDSGVVLDGDKSRVLDAAGCWWSLAPGDPWGEVAPREQVGDRSAAHGQWDATRYFGPRVITLTGMCHAPDHATLHATRWRLRQAASLAPFTYRVTEPGFDGYLFARQQGAPQFTELTQTLASYTVVLYAPDPRIFSTLDRTFGPLRFPQTSGGLEWNPTVTWGPTVSWDAPITSGRATVANPGNQPVGMRIRADGPADTLAISLSALGQTLHLEDPNGAPILRGGEYLVVDTATHDVLLMGDPEASRRGWAWGDWLTLPALSETEVAITGTGVDMTTSAVSGDYRAARI